MWLPRDPNIVQKIVTGVVGDPAAPGTFLVEHGEVDRVLGQSRNAVRGHRLGTLEVSPGVDVGVVGDHAETIERRRQQTFHRPLERQFHADQAGRSGVQRPEGFQDQGLVRFGIGHTGERDQFDVILNKPFYLLREEAERRDRVIREIPFQRQVELRSHGGVELAVAARHGAVVWLHAGIWIQLPERRSTEYSCDRNPHNDVVARIESKIQGRQQFGVLVTYLEILGCRQNEIWRRRVGIVDREGLHDQPLGTGAVVHVAHPDIAGVRRAVHVSAERDHGVDRVAVVLVIDVFVEAARGVFIQGLAGSRVEAAPCPDIVGAGNEGLLQRVEVGAQDRRGKLGAQRGQEVRLRRKRQTATERRNRLIDEGPAVQVSRPVTAFLPVGPDTGLDRIEPAGVELIGRIGPELNVRIIDQVLLYRLFHNAPMVHIGQRRRRSQRRNRTHTVLPVGHLRAGVSHQGVPVLDRNFRIGHRHVEVEGEAICRLELQVDAVVRRHVVDRLGGVLDERARAGGGKHGEDAGPVVVRDRCVGDPRKPLRYPHGPQVFGFVGHVAGIQHVECHVDAIRRSELQRRGDVEAITIREVHDPVEMVQGVAGHFHAVDDDGPGVTNVPILVQGV